MINLLIIAGLFAVLGGIALVIVCPAIFGTLLLIGLIGFGLLVGKG